MSNANKSSSCCEKFSDFCNYMCDSITSFVFNILTNWICVSFCSCVFGMCLMTIIVIAYYMVYFPSMPSASLEHTGMYDYINENPIVKREVYGEPVEMYGDYYYDESDGGNGEGSVKKRNVVAATTDSSPSTNSSQTPGQLSSVNLVSTMSTTQSSNRSTVSTTQFSNRTVNSHTKSHMSTMPTPNCTEPAEEEAEPDFHLSNAIMDSFYETASRNNMTQYLGLCRRNSDMKIPEFQTVLFPAEDASQILSCVNDIMAKRTKKQLCIQLDEDMNAYLRWLVLTGDPKGKHKAFKTIMKDDFLFPSTPCADEVYTPLEQGPECLVKHGLGEDHHDF